MTALYAIIMLVNGAVGAELELQVGSHATITVLAQADQSKTDIVVQRASVDLTGLSAHDTPLIDGMDSRALGDGQWLISLHHARPDLSVVAAVNEGMLVIDMKSPSIDESAVEDISSLSLQVLLDDYDRSPPQTVRPTLTYLHGEALSFRLKPRNHPLAFGEPEFLGTDSDKEDIDRVHADLLGWRRCGATCENQQALAMYELGWRYLEMGWNREGRHYIDRLEDNPGELLELDIITARTRAALATGDWSAARTLLRSAYDLGLPAGDVAEALGVISLATASPPRHKMGRLLLTLSTRPSARVLAAELLQVDGKEVETVDVLESLLISTKGVDRQRVALRLGDAYFQSGDGEMALRQWRDAPPELGRIRSVYAEIYRLGPPSWVTMVPHLRMLSREHNQAAAEAMYLVAQIDTQLGIDVDAIGDLIEFLDNFPQIAEVSDVPHRLWSVYASRVRRLYDAQRWYQLAALHESSWRHTLFGEVDDAEPLWMIAQAYENLGLSREAVGVLGDAFAVLVRDEVVHTEMILHLAKLYERSGMPRDALLTLEYLNGVSTNGDHLGEVAVMKGRILLGLGETTAALRSLRIAMTDDQHRSHAQVTLAVHEANNGDCEGSVETLEGLLMTEQGLSVWESSEPYMMLARCAHQQGDNALAVAAGREVIVRTPSEEESRYVAYLVSQYSEEPVLWADELDATDDIWSVLTRDTQREREFSEELHRRSN